MEPNISEEHMSPSSVSNSKPRKKLTEAGGKLILLSASAYFFDPEDGGNMFLQNIMFSLNYTVLQPRRLYA
jgi:hypothetical protein